jgi:hypothetical protein
MIHILLDRKIAIVTSCVILTVPSVPENMRFWQQKAAGKPVP